MNGKMLVLAAAGLLSAAGAPPSADHWVATWSAAQMVPGTADRLASTGIDVTLRQIVHLSLGGGRMRVRLSNAFGTQPLTVTAAAVAPGTPGSARIDPAQSVALTFAGRAQVTIPAGAEAYSDPAAFPTRDGADIAVTMVMPAPPTTQTSHPGARATAFAASAEPADAADLPGAASVQHWYQLADVEVTAPHGAGAVVAIGDSITDGHGAVLDGNTRWTDRLAQRLRTTRSPDRWGIVNAGIGGNRMLLDGLGPNLVARFDRDVIARAGVRTTIVLEGVNDLGTLTRDAPVDPAAHAALVAALTGAYRQVVARAHAHGIAVIGGTIMPFAGNDYYHPGPATEADRQAVNRFIRTSATFDAVIDFDRVMRDPARPDRLAPALDLGDHLHPSPAGYRAMGDAVPLALLSVRPRAVTPIVAAAAAVPVVDDPAAGPAIALTFDDLPAHGPLPPGGSRLAVTRALIAALRAQDAPAFGFVNGSFGADDPQSPEVLRAWRAAGLPLGNHSFSHGNLAQMSAAAFESDVARNEPVIAPLMRGADWHWFRYPFLSEGDTATKRDAVRGFLRRRGYKVAAVTMSFADYAWNEPYARCMARGDAGAVTALETSYLAAAAFESARQRRLAQASVGRDVPYVLLMHAGAFDARMLPRLLAQYRAEGFRFVTLPQAEADPFYRTAIDPAATGPSPGFRETTPSPSPPAPPLPSATLCR
ncbi:MAG: GDSL-type esterase/lipase family protein [Janthinobacterium lividum]